MEPSRTGSDRLRRVYATAGLVLAVMLAACTAAERRVVLTATPASGAPGGVWLPSPTSLAAEPTLLESEIGSYTSALALLDGVCFDYLSSLVGTTWTWTSPDDLAAFYDRVDESAQCVGAVPRGAYDFGAQVLVGTVGAAVGCDAAFRLLDVADDPAARAQRYVVELVVAPGCEYELLEPLVMAVPAPPDGLHAELGVIAP